MNAHDLIKEAIAEKGKFDSVYWIACGGSMIDLIPAHELLQRHGAPEVARVLDGGDELRQQCGHHVAQRLGQDDQQVRIERQA